MNDTELYLMVVLIGCALVTWVPRITPFILVKKLKLSQKVLEFLAYVPLTILTALFIQSLLIPQESGLPLINVERLIASTPTIATAILTKNLMWIVIVGILSMGALRLIY